MLKHTFVAGACECGAAGACECGAAFSMSHCRARQFVIAALDAAISCIEGVVQTLKTAKSRL